MPTNAYRGLLRATPRTPSERLLTPRTPSERLLQEGSLAIHSIRRLQAVPCLPRQSARSSTAPLPRWRVAALAWLVDAAPYSVETTRPSSLVDELRRAVGPAQRVPREAWAGVWFADHHAVEGRGHTRARLPFACFGVFPDALQAEAAYVRRRGEGAWAAKWERTLCHSCFRTVLRAELDSRQAL